MEREVIITGIGGQGIQLMAKVLAQAAARAGKQVMLFGIYGGMMRGGPSESTVVIGDDAIDAPPIVPHVWSVLAMHPLGLAETSTKLRPGGVLCVNSTLVNGSARDDVQLLAVPATQLAEQAGNRMGAGMIALGAFCAATELVAHDALVHALRDALPAHRQHLAEKNVQLLAQGAEFIHTGTASPPSLRVTGH